MDPGVPRSPPRRRASAGSWRAIWLASAIASIVFSLVEAVHASHARVGGALPASKTIALGAYTLPVYLFAGSCLGGVAWLTARAWAPLRRRVRLRMAGVTDREMTLALGSPVGLLFGLTYLTVRDFGSRFHNRDLSSALAAGLVVLEVALALLAWFATARVLGTLRRLVKHGSAADAGPAAWLAASVVPCTAVVSVLIANREALDTLGQAQLFGPVAAALAWILVSFIVTRATEPLVRRAVRAGYLGAAAAVLASALLGTWKPELPGIALDGSPWSNRLLRIAQRATDVDGDGDSSLFGGGDCAPFDPSVGPSQREVPADGIDNNCRGGDMRPSAAPEPPRWFTLPEPHAAPRHLIVITVEALRFDQTSLGPAPRRPTSPHLEELARTGALFTRFYATAPETREALTAIWSTRFPSEVRFQGSDTSAVIAPDNPWLPELLQHAGFHTTAIVPGVEYFSGPDDIGFRRGFDEYDATAQVARIGPHWLGFPSEGMVEQAIRAFDAHADERSMLWLHLVEPHAKYEQYPGAPKFGTRDIDLHASEVWGVDHQIGHFVELLRSRSAWASTVLLVVGDHGESFGEHGHYFHAAGLEDEQVHIAAVLRAPLVRPALITIPASQQDLGATLLNLLDVHAGFANLSGRNLTPALFGASMDARPFLLGLYPPNRVFQKERQLAVVDGPFKMYATPGRAEKVVFDVTRDPGETTPLDPEAVTNFALLEDTVDYHLDQLATP